MLKTNKPQKTTSFFKSANNMNIFVFTLLKQMYLQKKKKHKKKSKQNFEKKNVILLLSVLTKLN